MSLSLCTFFSGRLTPALVLFLLAQTACLKTRTQLREHDANDNAPSRPVSQKVQDVQPPVDYQVEEMKTEITRLNGRLEDLERAQKPDAEAVGKQDFKRLESRMTELEEAQATLIETVKKLQDQGASSGGASPDTSDNFERGQKRLNGGDYEGAIESFSAYLKHSKGKHAEEATFGRAEAYYKLKQYKKAIVDYSKFPEHYGHSKNVPAALYRIGLSFDALGMRDDAKNFYQELVEKFPKSPEAKKARGKVRG